MFQGLCSLITDDDCIALLTKNGLVVNYTLTSDVWIFKCYYSSAREATYWRNSYFQVGSREKYKVLKVMIGFLQSIEEPT